MSKGTQSLLGEVWCDPFPSCRDPALPGYTGHFDDSQMTPPILLTAGDQVTEGQNSGSSELGRLQCEHWFKSQLHLCLLTVILDISYLLLPLVFLSVKWAGWYLSPVVLIRNSKAYMSSACLSLPLTGFLRNFLLAVWVDSLLRGLPCRGRMFCSTPALHLRDASDTPVLTPSNVCPQMLPSVSGYRLPG